MKNIWAVFLVILLCVSVSAHSDMLGNPGMQVGEKNLFVGLEYSSLIHIYDIDTNNLETTSERVFFKVTTGLAEWFDLYIQAGGANLTLDYNATDSEVSDNFVSDFSPAFGAGTRIRLLNFVNSGTRVFFQGGALYFQAKDDVQWDRLNGSLFIKDRDIKWLDMRAALGVSKRMDYIDLTFGVGFSEVRWWLKDTEITKSGTTTSTVPRSWRDSFEAKNPVFGFLGLDFILPHEYRLSIQAGLRNIDEAEFGVAVSQGLERD